MQIKDIQALAKKHNLQIGQSVTSNRFDDAWAVYTTDGQSIWVVTQRGMIKKGDVLPKGLPEPVQIGAWEVAQQIKRHYCGEVSPWARR